MVTRSTINWEKHKADVFGYFRTKYGDKTALKFMDFYSERYDKFKRTFIHYKLAFSLLDDHHFVKRVGTRWFALLELGERAKALWQKMYSTFLTIPFL